MTDTPPFAAFAPVIRAPSPLRAAITAAYRHDEAEALAPLIAAATLPPERAAAVLATARTLVTALRATPSGSGVEGLVQE